jgi:hypothetical protein
MNSLIAAAASARAGRNPGFTVNLT